MTETGVIHGRFQVLHNDHMKYLLAGKARCRHLIVGITNPDPRLTKDDSADSERSLPSANPLTYFERYTTLRSAAPGSRPQREGILRGPAADKFSRTLFHDVPLDAVFYLTIYDDWGRRKLEMFESGTQDRSALGKSTGRQRHHQQRNSGPNDTRGSLGAPGSAECRDHGALGHTRTVAEACGE